MVQTVGGLNDPTSISVSLHRLQKMLRVTLVADRINLEKNDGFHNSHR